MVKSTRIESSRGAGMAIVIFSVVIMVFMAVTTVQILNSKVMFQEYNRLRNAVEAAVAGSVIHVSTADTDSSGNYVDDQKQLSMGYIINEDETGTEDVKTGEVNNYYKIDHQKANKYTLELIKKSMNISDTDIRDTSKVKILMVAIEPYYDAETFKRGYNIYYYGNGKDSVHDYSIEPIKVDNISTNNGFSAVEADINGFLAEVSGVPAEYRSAKRKYSININNEKDYINALTNHQYYLVLVNDFPLNTLIANKSSDIDNFTPICAMQGSQSSRD